MGSVGIILKLDTIGVIQAKFQIGPVISKENIYDKLQRYDQNNEHHVIAKAHMPWPLDKTAKNANIRQY